MRFLSFVLVLVLLIGAGGAAFAGHDGPGNEAGSDKSEHPGHDAPKGSASPSPATTPAAAPSPSPAR